MYQNLINVYIVLEDIIIEVDVLEYSYTIQLAEEGCVPNIKYSHQLVLSSLSSLSGQNNMFCDKNT